MKITDQKAMQSGEKAFFNAVKDHLDWNAIREVVTKKMKQCAIESKGGELIFHENNVAFKINLHCSMDVSITVDRNGNLISGEDPLVDRSMTQAPPMGSPETQIPTPPPGSSGDTKKKLTHRILVQPATRIKKNDKKEALADDDSAAVLELNDLLDSPSPIKEGENSSDDGDMDLETLFFKDKADDDDDDDDFDILEDEGNAFWEDKK